MLASRSRNRIAATALAAAAGFGLGLLAGLVAGEWLGDVDTDRVRRAVARLAATRGATPADRAAIEHAVRSALGADAATRYLRIQVKVLGERLLELTGTVPTEEARQRAGQAAREAAPDCTVINRVLVEGEDVRHGSAAGPST